jgi:hypothetical protein
LGGVVIRVVRRVVGAIISSRRIGVNRVSVFLARAPRILTPTGGGAGRHLPRFYFLFSFRPSLPIVPTKLALLSNEWPIFALSLANIPIV